MKIRWTFPCMVAIAIGACSTSTPATDGGGGSLGQGGASAGGTTAPQLGGAVGSGGVIAIPVPGRTGSWMPIQLPQPADLFAVATNDTGTQIVAAGQGGTIWSSVGANPLGAVSLISPLRVIYTGADVTLQATNTGIAPTSYQWQFNGVPISGATQQTLTLRNVQMAQIGTYSCTVNSATASVTPSTQLTVQLTPPSLGLLTINAFVASDGVIVPVQCEYLSLRGLVQLENTLSMVRENLNPRVEIQGILPTMYDKRTLHSREAIDILQENFGDLVFNTRISKTIRFAEAPVKGSSVLKYDPKGEAAGYYRDLAKEVLNGAKTRKHA